jgi:hypothetical protein
MQAGVVAAVKVLQCKKFKILIKPRKIPGFLILLNGNIFSRQITIFSSGTVRKNNREQHS